MFELTLIPAYDHVYNSKKAVWDGWCAGHDFRIATANHRDYGRYIDHEDAARCKSAVVARAISYRK